MKQLKNRPMGLIADVRPHTDDRLIANLPVVEIGGGGLQRAGGGGRFCGGENA
jgi:hypothetical protein